MTVAQLTPRVVFLVGVAALLILDIGVLSRRSEIMTTRSALIWSAVWISLGLSFSLAVWAWRGGLAAQEYLAGHLVEESLSIDNLSGFTIVFGSLGIALRNPRTVLLWRILGAIVMRGVFILVGVRMLLSQLIHVPTYVPLSVIVVAVGGAVLVSLWMTRGGTTPPGGADR